MCPTSNREDISTGLPLFEKGDVLFAKISVHGERERGVCGNCQPASLRAHVLRAGKKVGVSIRHIQPHYRAYAAENMVGAAGQKRVSSRFLKDTRLFLPPLPEQQRIAAYLAASCAGIDAAVAAKRRQLQTLEALKSSILLQALTLGLKHGIETRATGAPVLPTVPIGWGFRRLKSVATIRYGLGQPPVELSSGVAMIRATDVSAGTIRTGDFLRVDPDDLPRGRNPYLKSGEIIVVRSGAYTGDSAIVPPDLEGMIAGYDMVLTVTRASPRFVAYSLLSRYVLEGQLLLLTLRAAQPHLNATELGSILLALPPTLKEQEAIADFIATKFAELNSLASAIKSQITTLTAYRKSLIHECVTGQRRITEADLNRVESHG